MRAALHGEPVRPGRDFKLHRGTLFWDDQRLAATIADAADHGLQTAQHAMGNEAIEQATRGLRALGPRLDSLPGRPRLEHTVFCGPDVATRIADVGAIAVVSPIWLDELGRAFRNAAKLAGPSPIPLNTLAKAGVTLAGASDYPSAHYRVLPAIQAPVTRRVISDGTLRGPEEAITAEHAVRAYTTGSAAALGVEDIAGSMTIGKQADLVILSNNPLDVDPSLIGSIQVLRTYVAGTAVHSVGTFG